MLHLFNTLSRKLEPFEPLNPPKVIFYHCGPTVYWTQHIGNLRGMTMGDLLVRSLRYLGYEVTHVRNYTDVGHMTSDRDTGEDKIEKGAKREGLTPQEIAQKYIDSFERDVAEINLLVPTFTPRASEYIKEMQTMISELIQKGYAYETDLAVYYDVSKFRDYTKLSHQKLDELVHGAGKADVTDPQKKHPLDFALWFFRTGTHAHALQHWLSPFHSHAVTDGDGFPGWHIECSAMCRKLLGKTVDIHMGGVEHIPVHHTNEIAQSEAANGVPFVRYWLHNEHLVVSNEKMAKSQGTGMSLEEIKQKRFHPLALRYFYLTAHYRTRQNFTWEALRNAQLSYNELTLQVSKLREIGTTRLSLSPEKLKKIDMYNQSFRDAISDDLNIPKALSFVWQVVKSNIPPEDKYDLILNFDDVLGLNLKNVQGTGEQDKEALPPDIINLIKQRDELRMMKKFNEADVIRRQIEEKGYSIQDSCTASFVRKTST